MPRFSVWCSYAGVAAAHFVWAAPALAQETPAGERAPDRFLVAAYDVAGVTKLSLDEVETAVYQYTGPDRTEQDVLGAVKALQDAYTKKGYETVVVDLPNQPIDLFSQGIVQIKVSEAPVGRVRVTGSRFHSLSILRAQIPSVKEGEPISIPKLQAEVAEANRFPDRTVTPSFSRGQVPGTVDVDLKVEDKSGLHASIEVNNDHSPATKPIRTVSSVRYTNLWQLGHSLSATYIVAPENRKQTEVISGSYTAPILNSPWTIVLFGYKSNSNIAALGGTNVLGNGYQVGLRAVYRLPTKSTSQSFGFGFDYKDFKQDIFVNGVSAGRAPIRYVPLSLEYNLAGANDESSYSLTLGTTAGLRFLRRVVDCVVAPGDTICTPVDQFQQREIDARENFFRVNLGADYSLALPDDFVFATRFSGQYSDSRLVSNEQFSVGGLTSIRGYLQSEGVGDQGYEASAEFRLPSLASMLGDDVDEFRLYGFVDSGYAHVRRVLPEQKADFRLLSVGGGLKVRVFKLFSGEVVVGVPLRDGPNSKRGDPRATFTAKGEF